MNKARWSCALAAGLLAGGIAVLVANTSTADPGRSDILPAYAAYQGLAAREPALWAGAYVNGNVLAIGYVGQTEGQAQDRLAAAGVTSGFVLRPAEVSEAAIASTLSDLEPTLRNDPSIVSWGPDFSHAGIVVSTTGSQAEVGARLKAASRHGVPITVEWASGRPSLDH